MLVNGYSSAATAKGTVLLRSDKSNTTDCIAPPSSGQIEIGGITYPSNAISLANQGVTTLLNHSELYNEYRKAFGRNCPAIDENIFKRTMPFFVVKPNANNKLVQSSDIVVRLPGFSPGSNTGAAAAQVRILWGRLRGFTIASSGAVNEAISSF
jgi:hypothetical protein